MKVNLAHRRLFPRKIKKERRLHRNPHFVRAACPDWMEAGNREFLDAFGGGPQPRERLIMGWRTFHDRDALWQVWSVIPGVRDGNERRAGRDRRSPEPVIRYTGPERRTSVDRRRTALAVSAALAAGWLVFEGPTERRRLAPIPMDWEALPDDALADLLERARPVPPRAR